MGFTRYWERPDKPVSADKWNALTRDVRKIFAMHKGLIAMEYDLPDREPVVDDTVIRFNGIGEDGHETFRLTRNFEQQSWRRKGESHSSFCKTARKPYDEVVAAVLSCVEHHLGDIFKVSSDDDDDNFSYDSISKKYNLQGQ